jgi:hypothetical protein
LASPALSAIADATRTTDAFHETLDRASFAEFHRARAIGADMSANSIRRARARQFGDDLADRSC